MKVEWIDVGREPTQKPNPKFPNGVDLDTGERPACKVDLPYPAKRIGYFYIECEACGSNALITTAGRPDDPRSIHMICKAKGNA